MKAGIGIIAVVGVLASSAALADGNKFIVECKQAVAAIDAPEWPQGSSRIGFGHCLGVVEGVMNTMFYMNKRLDPEVQVCWPEESLTNAQAARIVVKYLDDNPALLTQDSTVLTIKAFMQAFPCK
ncbi:Rap1a/Tai family immunity protein [Pseudomonas sp. PS02290]|uniref:Rap1a/Tai family immunity protein n=1 Tax=Pseudomonas sp. PS02290 TaxID=2991430 RepID=UPI00249C6F83|nr:Rap1a/Tai family immunity protein [Pseudomonas sp. PS02290]